MSDNTSNNKQIAKNTFFMYFRMGITMIVGLYTSRVVLQQLGVEDYGLYNVIGGIIAMFTFLNGSMVNATSRFITFYLAKKDNAMLNNIFSMAFLIHLCIAAIIIFLAETVGLYYLNNKLVIPDGREFTAQWLYQLSILSCVLSILYVPYNATIVAHEKMKAFAYIAIMDVLLKLTVVLLLVYSLFDKLLFYAICLTGVSILDFLIYFVYCKRHFRETRIKYYWSRSIFKEMMGFAGWALVGNFSHLFYSQGINLMLNAFCGPAVNAARGIAVQVESLVRQFANNVQIAINPQIYKSYAVKDMDRMYGLIMASSRLSFFLLFIISLPLFIETDYILSLWLGTVPDHTVNFVRIILMNVLLDAFVNPMFTANLASGKLAIYHGPLSVLMYGFMFITYFTIKCTKIPETVFICYLAASIIGYVMKIFIMNYQIGLKPRIYVRRTLLPVITVVVVSIVAPLIVHHFLVGGWIDFIVTSTVALISVAIVVFFLGITHEERSYVLNFFRSKLRLNNKEV